MLDRILLSLFFGFSVSALAYIAGALTVSGAIAATLVGSLTYGFGGLAPTAMLLAFFISSSALSHWGADRKRRAGAEFAKVGRRDASQVLANGLLPAALAVGYGLVGGDGWLAGLAGALASSTADTWATEIGLLARGEPRLITTGDRVPRGTSGAISTLGTAAAFFGAAFIAAVGWLLHADGGIAFGALLGGLLGATSDSLLGATWQSMYTCSRCGHATEQHPTHHCGGKTRPLRGWRWMQNDMVNLVAAAIGAGLALGLSALVG